MRNSDPLSNPLLASVRCDFFGLDIAAVAGIASAVVGIAATGFSLIQGQQASSQAAAMAQQQANQQAMIQQQNAMVAHSMAVAQAQQQAQIASFNMQVAAQQQSANQALVAQNRQIALAQASVEAQNIEIAKRNANLARTQAQMAQNQHDVGLQNAKQLEDQGNAVRAQQREEARRLREESEQRIAAIRSKYAGSGVTFEGSPLIVLADAAQLAETSVQDSAYIAELEARKQFREGEMAKFKAGFSLLDKAGYLNQAAAFEASAFASEVDQFNAISAAEATRIESFNIAARGAQDQATFATQIAGAQYDTLIAGAKNRIALNEAELTRFGGAAQAFSIQSQARANMISGIGDLAGGAIGAVSSISKLKPKTVAPYSPGYRS